AGLVHAIAQLLGGSEGALESREARVAMHEDAIEEALREPDRLRLALRAALDQIAHGADNERTRLQALCVLEERQELEAHLAPAEREELDEQHVSARGAPGIEQRSRAQTLPVVVDRAPRFVEERPEC